MRERLIVVSNGIGRFHVYRAAQAAEKAGLLRYFLTSFCITDQWQESLLDNRITRTFIGEKFVKKGLLRKYDDIDSKHVKSFVAPELFLKTQGILGRWSDRIPTNTLLMFSRLSVPYVRGCRLFHVRSGFGNMAITHAKEAGAICLVDHSAAAPKFIEHIDVHDPERQGSKHDFSKWQLVAEDLEASDFIVANSTFVKRTLVESQQLSPSKILVIPMGVDTQLFRPKPKVENDNTRFDILYVGAISKRKGVWYLLEAFKRLKLTNAKLTLIGAMGNAGDDLKGIDGAIEYVPHLPHHELVARYQAASVFVFPSLAEGSALVNYEAMACGLPVITTSEAGSVVRDGTDGFIVPSRDVDALIDRISFLYTHREVAQEMGMAAREYVATHYTWQHYAESIVRLYQGLLSGESIEPLSFHSSTFSIPSEGPVT